MILKISKYHNYNPSEWSCEWWKSPAFQERSGDSKGWSHPPRHDANKTEGQNLRHNPSTQDIPFIWEVYHQEINAEFTCQFCPDCSERQWTHGFMNLFVAIQVQGVPVLIPEFRGTLPGKLPIVMGSRCFTLLQVQSPLGLGELTLSLSPSPPQLITLVLWHLLSKTFLSSQLEKAPIWWSFIIPPFRQFSTHGGTFKQCEQCQSFCMLPQLGIKR